MSAEFFCGGHVVCTDATPPAVGGGSLLVQGRVYVPVSFVDYDDQHFVMLDSVDGLWLVRRFKPLDENRLAMLRGIVSGIRLVEAA